MKIKEYRTASKWLAIHGNGKYKGWKMKVEEYNTESEWLAARKKYITATKAYKLAKGQNIDNDSHNINTYAVQWGKERERYLADYIVKESYRAGLLHMGLKHSNNELYIHENGRDAFSPDVIGNNILYEIKTSSKLNAIKDLTANDIFKMRPEWFAQIQWQLHVSGFDGGYLALETYEISCEDGEPYFTPQNLRFFYIVKDDEYIQNMLNNIEANINSIDLTPAESETLREYIDSLEVMEEVKQHIEDIKPKVLEILKAKKVDNLTFKGFKFMSIPAKTVKRFATSAFKADNPDLYKYYIQETEQQEFLKVTKRKENNG